MPTSNIIKNTAIIALSISTTIGIIQTCGAKQETKAAETKTKNATTQVTELKKENAIKVDALNETITQAQTAIDGMQAEKYKQNETIKNARTQVKRLENENANLKNLLAAKPKTITKTVTKKIQSSDPYSLPKCTHYSQRSCIWRATDRDNNIRMTYMTDANGHDWYRDDAILGEMIGWTDYM